MFCLVALIPQVIQKIITYRCGIIMIAPGWPGMSWFWDLVDLSTRLPLRLPLWVNLLTQQQTSQQSDLPESSCLAPGVSHEYSERFSEEVAKRIKEPQRHSSRRIYESRWSIFGKWCEESQVDVSNPTIPDVADFLNCLRKEISSHLPLLAIEQLLQMVWV